MEVNCHGVNPTNSFDSSFDRCSTELALQQRLGLLAEWRYRPDRGDRLDSSASWAHLEPRIDASV